MTENWKLTCDMDEVVFYGDIDYASDGSRQVTSMTMTRAFEADADGDGVDLCLMTLTTMTSV